MMTSDERTTAKAISAIVTRYHKIIVNAATGGPCVRIMTPDTDRPDLLVRGDAHGRAQLEICTDDGDRHVVFSHWPEGDRFFPENWPRLLPVPDYARDPMP